MPHHYAYYNEPDRFASEWLQALIAEGLIADGAVDTRPIQEVEPADLSGFTQHHFFAGIGGWSWALRLADWPDDLPVWTGSCPCQPFSQSGKREGIDDDRHLWPYWAYLIGECRPPVVFGEQVASPLGRSWLDHVLTDLEDLGYRGAAGDICAAGVGAPHLRQRLYWVADTNGGNTEAEGLQRSGEHRQQQKDGSDIERFVAVSKSTGRPECVVGIKCDEREAESQSTRVSDRLAYSTSRGPGAIQQQRRLRVAEPQSTNGAGGFWSPADWLACRDGLSRPVEPGTFPLVDGLPGRVGYLRGYGNAIVPPLAAAFIEAYCEARE